MAASAKLTSCTFCEAGSRAADLLTQQVRRVRERKGSTLLVARDALLGRVVELGGVHVIRGMYPRPLGPEDAAEVVARARKRLRGKSGSELLTALRNPIHAHWDNTVVGRAFFLRDELRLESNSKKRADALRGRVEQAAGKLLRHRAREHSDPLSERARGQRSQPSPAPPSPEMLAAVREEKERVYEAWLDQPIPALGGKTPRRAARSKRGRHEVDLLLKTIENREARLPEAERFDVGQLRVALGLPP